MANTAGTQASLLNGNGQTMNADAASYWNAMVRKIKVDTGIDIVATEGTRTYARQLELYKMYLNGTGNPAWNPNSPNAYHLSGRAVDVGSRVGFVKENNARVFRAYAGQYGFHETVKGEPWHFEWRAEWVSPSIGAVVAAGEKPSPIVTIPTENGDIQLYESTCTLYEAKGSGALVLGTPQGFFELGDKTGVGFDGNAQLEVITKLAIKRVTFENKILLDRWVAMNRAAK